MKKKNTAARLQKAFFLAITALMPFIQSQGSSSARCHPKQKAQRLNKIRRRESRAAARGGLVGETGVTGRRMRAACTCTGASTLLAASRRGLRGRGFYRPTLATSADHIESREDDAGGTPSCQDLAASGDGSRVSPSWRDRNCVSMTVSHKIKAMLLKFQQSL